MDDESGDMDDESITMDDESITMLLTIRGKGVVIGAQYGQLLPVFSVHSVFAKRALWCHERFVEL